MGYLTNFIVYTFAMVGIMVIALLVFKNSTGGGGNKHSKFLKVIDSISLGPRKTLYIVSAGEEKFLIAGDSERTSLISKLNSGRTAAEEKIPAIATMEEEDFSTIPAKSFKETMNNLPRQKSYIDRSILGIKKTESPYNSVMKNLAAKMNSGRFIENRNNFAEFSVTKLGGD